MVIGEVLFDLFQDGQAVLGGAPFNVAWHLQGFGQAPLFISRIGEDKYGEQITTSMQNWGMDTAGLQIDSKYATGVVEVKLDNGLPTFDICNDVAYDHIDIKQADKLISSTSIPLLYHGSLAARNALVYDTILQFRQATQTSFVDINLRSPWWEKQKVFNLIQGANWLKVNDDELMTLTNVKNVLPDMISTAKDLLQEYGIDAIILTRGDQGAVIITANEVHQSRPIKVKNIKDTVGAGDAFSSICIMGLINDWDTMTMLERATAFAAKICQQQGAIQENHNLYETFIEKWQLT